jgi:hypothetical protein
MLSINPWPSVLSPKIIPFLKVIKFTAPSSFAVADKTSHALRAFSLCGTVMFSPEKPSFAALVIKSVKFSSLTVFFV